MRCSLILLAGVAAACVAGSGAVAQEQRYETPAYTTGTGSTLDKNFGLPPMGGPPQKTMEPEARVPPQPDFFPKTTDFDWPKPQTSTSTSTASAMETPLFTTPETSTTGDMTTGGFTTGNSAISGPTYGVGTPASRQGVNGR